MKGCDLDNLEIELKTLKYYMMSFAIYALLALIAIMWSMDPESLRLKSITGLYLMGGIIMMMLSANLLKYGLKSCHKSMVVVVLGLQLLAFLTVGLGNLDNSKLFGLDVQFFILAAFLDGSGIVTTMSGIDRVMRRCHAAD